MRSYIASLQHLLDYPVRHIAPGHGELIADSEAEIRHLVEHRLARESKVIAGLEALGPCDTDLLVQRVYDDVDSALHPWAKMSMLAHLIKLEQELRARRDESNRWSMLPAP